MKCLRCRRENRLGARFCNGCGQPLALSCPSCETRNPPESQFCNACGQVLLATASQSGGNLSSVPEEQTAVRAEDQAERRQLTVMFCDLVGSTALSERLDPEELREVIRGYQEACADVIQGFDGHVAQYLGDGLLVYFGYPQAHEDDAQRTVRAGLGIIEAIKRLPPALEGVPLTVRVGVHTGLVVIGEVGGGSRHEQLALGDTPNLAARLQALAEPNTVVISGATQRLVKGVFVLQDLGRPALKGVSAPVNAYHVSGETGAQSRLDVAGPTGLTSLVGREQEVALLLDRWDQAVEGHGQVALLNGEPGIGKSRLVQVVKDRVTGAPHWRLECRCSPYYTHSPLYPVIDLLPRLLGWSQDETPEGKLATLERRLADYPLSLADVMPLLASLLALPPPDLHPLPPMSPQRQKQKTLEAILAVLLAMAAAEPVLLVVEDLHWIDPTTLELLALLLHQAPTARMLILLTARPAFHPPWIPCAHLTVLTLDRFPPRQTELMVSQVAGGKDLPTEVVQQIVVKTDGVPLFVEELTKMVLESGLVREQNDHYELTGPLPPLAIPSTLQDSLMARLDRLATAKEVAQLSATCGRAFPYDLLRAVSLLDDATLQRDLGRLVEAELLYQRGVAPTATYTFKHALIQETAYQSLLKSTRRQYHQRIARAVVEQFPDLAATRPEYVAHHYTEAGLTRQAVAYWQRAGQRAMERSAPAETVAHCTRGVAMLATLPDSLERTELELTLQLALGNALIQTKGVAAPEVEPPFTRARELSERMGHTLQLFGALWGLFMFHLVGARHHRAREFAERCFEIAQHTEDPGLVTVAEWALGDTLFWTGKLVSSRTHFERSVAAYDPERHRSHGTVYGHDPAVAALAYLGFLLCVLGYPDRALHKAQEALTLAGQLAHPFSLAWARCFAAILHCLRREWRLAQRWAEETIALSAEQGFPFWDAWGNAMRGIALAQREPEGQGIELLTHSIAALQLMGTEKAVPLLLGFGADACCRTGHAEEGLSALAKAFVLIEKTGEWSNESDLARVKGDLLLKQRVPDEHEAEAALHRANEIARHQQAKWFELRATVSLSRVWLRQGKSDAARRMLAEIYGWFTEGFETPDLKEAKALLEELA